MQECPKCGFLQPQDRFCANCGLNIESYRPAPTPWYRQLLLNPTFQVSAIVLTIGAMVTYIAWQQSQKINQAPHPQFVGEDSPREKKSATSTTKASAKNTSAKNTSAKKPSSTHTTAAKSKAANTPVTNEKKLPEGASPQQIPPPKSAPSQEEQKKADTKTKDKAAPTNLVVRFAEFPKETLNQIFSEAQILHESAQFQVGLYRFQGSLSDFIKKNPQSRFLPGKGQGPLTGSGVHIQYTKPLTENSEELQGLTFNVAIASLNSTEVEVETSGGFYLSGEEPDQAVKIPLDGSYTVDYQSTLIITGIIPHRPFSEKEASAFNRSPIEIMNSQEFLANETEFVLLLQAN